MKRFFAFLVFCAFAAALHAQVVDTTICNILKDPVSFNGKIVRIKGTVSAGFDSFIVKDKSCQSQMNALWLSYPEGTKGKAGPAVLLELQPAKNFGGTYEPVTRTPIKLEKNSDFKEFDKLLSTQHKIDGMCLGCMRYEVSATLVGRLDGVAHAGVRRDKSGKIVGIEGFGNLNAYPARLVLESVSDVSPHEADYSKSDAVAKNDDSATSISQGADAEAMSTASSIRSNSRFATTLDSVQALGVIHQAASAFPPGSPAQIAIERAAGAYGKDAEHTGVLTTFGSANEVSAKDEAQGTRDSPDGVLFQCTLNMGRLHGAAMARAMVHIGEHIADVRTPPAGGPLASLYDKEFQAWAVTVLDVVGSRQNTLTLPGGYLVWNGSWATADQGKLSEGAITRFLTDEELLSR